MSTRSALLSPSVVCGDRDRAYPLLRRPLCRRVKWGDAALTSLLSPRVQPAVSD